ncbi:MAG: SIS domain-containing protein [Ideonella sp.]
MLTRIAASRLALAPAELRVANLLLGDPAAFVESPVGLLAERAGVSKPTVVRFCRSVGYDGLADFKRKLAGIVNEGVPFVHRSVDEGDQPRDIQVKLIDNTIAALLKYREQASASAFERAAAALTNAVRSGHRIDFYGVGNSGIVAQDAQHKFFRLGVHAQAVTDSHVQVMSATMLQPGDCAVFISNSGRSRGLLEVAEIARDKGATIIMITAGSSPLAQTVKPSDDSQILLAVDHPEDHERYSPMVSRQLHLMVIDILTTAVALRLPSDRRVAMQEIKQNLSRKLYSAQA